MDYERPGMVALRWCFVVLLLLVPRTAFAQIHWDASAQLGAMKRFMTERPRGADDASIGPMGQLTAHIALLPLVHVGGYLGYEISPLPDPAAARNITTMGVRGKVAIPMSGDFHAWGFAGFGLALVHQQAYAIHNFPYVTGAGTVSPKEASIDEAGGHFFEIPFGLGVAYKLRKPWELCAELGARIGIAHTGSVYDDPGPQLHIDQLPDQNVLPAGIDRFSVGLTVGVMLDL